jgi:hypothetical protein
MMCYRSCSQMRGKGAVMLLLVVLASHAFSVQGKYVLR